MSEQLNNNSSFSSEQEEEMEIDLMAMARKLWAERKVLYKAAGIGLVLGVIIALSIPKKYTVDMILSPEVGKSNNGTFSGIASMLGMSNLNSASGDVDALNISLFPDIISSTPFILELFDVPVTPDEEDAVTQPLNEYLTNRSGSWIGAVISLPGQAIGAIMSLFEEEEEPSDTLNPFRLNRDQANLVESLRKSMSADVDKKTGVTTVSVTMNDPLVTATVCDTVVAKLQEYVTAYRVSKAQNDCEYLEKLFNERRQEYYDAQALYAEFVDANKGVILQSALTERERLQNDMNLAYQIYSHVASQLQVARGKVQEAKPVFAVVEPATVPLLPSGASRKIIVLAFIFLACAGTAAWILFGRDMLANLKTGLAEPVEAENTEENA